MGIITRVPYVGRGLGPTGEWKCPACGTSHATPIEQGCGQCGAGTAEQRTDAYMAKDAATITEEELEILLGIAGSGE